MQEEFTLRTFEAKKEKLDEVLAFVADLLDEHDCSMKANLQIAIAVEELFVNVASYAYPQTEGNCTIKVEFIGNHVEITFIDSGIPFNPLTKKDPDITLPAEQRDIGGLGIYMVKTTMTDIRYEYTDNKNILTIVKEIN